MRRHYSTRDFTVKLVRELHQEARLLTDVAYQRGRVWKDREKQYLIDSLSRGLPIGMITLFSRRDEDNLEIFEVIDGKQRLTTILEYVNSEFVLPTELDKEIPTSTFSQSSGADLTVEIGTEDDEIMQIEVGQKQRELLQGFKYRDLKLAVKKQFDEIVIPAFVVSADKRHLAVDIFVRMNKNVKGLVPQEIRNAVYHKSLFLKTASVISKSLDRKSTKELDSKDRWFCTSGFMKPERFDRQADIQFILELLCLALYGVTHRRDRLDSACDEFIEVNDQKVKKLKLAEEQVVEALKKISAIAAKGFKNLSFPSTAQIENDIYGLVGALLRYRKSLSFIQANSDSYADIIRDFRGQVTIFNEFQKGRRSTKTARKQASELPTNEFEKMAFRYSQSYLGGQTNSDRRRSERIEIWGSVLEAVAPSNDENRTFSEVQKALIWARSKDKVCAKCGTAIRDKWDAGHRTAWRESGRTTVENGQIECIPCNRSNR